jgi:hypothetical protein
LRQRWAEIRSIFSANPQSAIRNPQSLILAEEFPDGSALARVIEAGGEGICAHGWDAPFGADFYAAKHLETFRCEITAFIEGTQSVETVISDKWPVMSQAENSSPVTRHSSLARTRVPLRGNKIDRVRVGSIIKVEGMGLTPAGRIREPRVCQDTPDSWLVAW